MSSVLCDTSSRVHLKFKPSSSFNFEDVIKKSLPDGSIILKNRQRSAKKNNSPEDMLVVAKLATPLPAVGMLNTANNCYINASLQVLLRMPLFGATITRLEHNHCELSFCMINFLKMVLKKLSRGERVPISLLLENIRAINKDFRRGQQEDAHEMILSTLEYIRSDLRCGSRSNPPPDVAEVFQNIERALFTKYRQSIRCGACGNISVTNTSDAFVVVGCGDSLEMALRQHFGTEVLEGDCAYHCDKCRAKVRATKRLAIDKPGEYFAVQLSRFHYDGYKNSSYVPFPETINLTEFTENPSGPVNTYALFATIIHEGDSTRSGHYLSIVKVNNKYKIFNDLDVDDTSWREVKHTRPYIIIYAKVHRQLVCNANMLKRKLEAANNKEEPLAKKAFSSFGLSNIRPIASNAVTVSAAYSAASPAAKAKPEIIRAAPKLVWHRPVSAPQQRKAQVILSQEPHEEIQNIAPKPQDSYRIYKNIMPRPVRVSEVGGQEKASDSSASYQGKSSESSASYQGKSSESALQRTTVYQGKSFDSFQRTASYNGKASDSFQRTSSYNGKSSDSVQRTAGYQGKSSESLQRTASYNGRASDSLQRIANYQGKSSDSFQRTASYNGKSSDSLQRNSSYQGKSSDFLPRTVSYPTKFVSVRPLQRQKENSVRPYSHHGHQQSNHNSYQSSYKAAAGYGESQYRDRHSNNKHVYNNGHHNGYHNSYHNYQYNNFHHNNTGSKISKPVLGGHQNNGFHNGYKYNNGIYKTSHEYQSECRKDYMNKEGLMNGHMKHFYKAYQRKHPQ